MRVSFDEIYKVIADHYPIGLLTTDKAYNQHPGLKVAKAIREAINPEKWEKFVLSISRHNMNLNEGLVDKVDWGLDGSACYGQVLLFETDIAGVRYKRQINFHLSLLAPLYAVYGIDNIAVKTPSQVHVTFDPVIFISPIDIYDRWFRIIRQHIEAYSSGARFVPFSVLSRKVPSLSIPGAILKRGTDPSVFQALFSGNDITDYRYFGNILYE